MLRRAAHNPETLYRQYAPMILRRVRHFFRGPEAEEVLQDIFLRLLERPELTDDVSSTVTWLYRVTTNHCITQLRKKRRRSELLEQHAQSFQPTTEQARQEARALLNQMFRGLDDELAAMGLYYYLDGLTHAEIARIMDCSPRTVGNRLDTLRVQLHAAEARA